MKQTELFRVPTAAAPSRLRVIDVRKRGATFVEHRVRSIINSPESTGMGFWSINPYVGCEFGCTYCYARNAHRYVIERSHSNGQISDAVLSQFRESSNWEIFERRIFVKQREGVLAALERDLSRMRLRHSNGRLHPLLIGTATDPYQPAERKFGVTRAVLERLQRESGLTIGIITKSPHVSLDIDILNELQQRNRVTVYISLITTDTRLIKLFEARSPMPRVRLNTLRRLTAAGLNAGLIVAPVLPGITDTDLQIRALMRAAKEAGGCFVHTSPLRLYPELHGGFLPIIENHFPELYPKYRRAYRGAGYAPRRYTDAVLRRFRDIAIEFGLSVEDPVMDGGQRRSRAVKDGRGRSKTGRRPGPSGWDAGMGGTVEGGGEVKRDRRVGWSGGAGPTGRDGGVAVGWNDQLGLWGGNGSRTL